MKVLLVRHGATVEDEAWAETGKADEFRPLTEDGKGKCRQSFGALKGHIEGVDTIATSPMTCGIETAEILARVFPTVNAATNSILKPDANADEAIAWLTRRSPDQTVALISHEPFLNGLIARMCGLRDDSVAEVKHGYCALVEFEGKPGPSHGNLLWVNQPKKKT